MYIKFGNFQFEPYEAGLSVSVVPRRTPRGFKTTLDARFDIQGELCVSGAPAITARLLQIRDAFAFDGKDIGLYQDDNTPTVHYLESSHPLNLTGNQVLYQNYPQTVDGEYVTGRKFSIGVGATIVDAENNLIEYKDTIALSGNAGPKFRWKYNDLWGHYPELDSPVSLQRIVHSGRAVGMVNYITPPPPFYFPPFEDNTARYVKWGSPRRMPQGYTEYETEWRYFYTIPVADDFLRPTQR